MIDNIKEKVKQAYQNDKLLYPLVDEMCEEINGTETDVENLEVTDLGSGNATAGKVATADGSGNVEWQNVPNELPDYDVSADEGKVLKVGSEGVEWGSAGDKLYCHAIKIGTLATRGRFTRLLLYSKQSTPFTLNQIAKIAYDLTGSASQYSDNNIFSSTQINNSDNTIETMNYYTVLSSNVPVLHCYKIVYSITNGTLTTNDVVVQSSAISDTVVEV